MVIQLDGERKLIISLIWSLNPPMDRGYFRTLEMERVMNTKLLQYAILDFKFETKSIHLISFKIFMIHAREQLVIFVDKICVFEHFYMMNFLLWINIVFLN